MKTVDQLLKSEKVIFLKSVGKRKHHFTEKTLIATSRGDAFLGCLMAANNVDEHIDILFVGDAETALNELTQLK